MQRIAGPVAHRLGWLAVGLFLTGCPGPTDPCGEPTVEIGTGWERYEELPAEPELVMVHGPQGGWHLLVAARVTAMADSVGLHVTVADDLTGVLLADGLYEVRLREEDDCVGTYPGMFAILSVSDLEEGDADTPPEVLAGRDLRIRVEADDGDRFAVAERVVVAALDPVDQ